MEIIEVEIEQGYLTIKTHCQVLSLTNKQVSLSVAGNSTIDGERSVDHVVSHPVVLDIPGVMYWYASIFCADLKRLLLLRYMTTF